ncbi:polyamine aminopropyltransferase [Kibdelosporangium philippinense]|uniref:Polyamine aminopropyltransferase n=1 Tax=Kibdelosporangium philippinense TaxID=211113 RepID=A0ABS8ZAB9_9PSEU|nr:polyamine aminopropyltransferase [Kibdelosporangium philippinense]MCE7004804.1 polyamine aminopropyltransferase [Kibdelosporangium philippinense]
MSQRLARIAVLAAVFVCAACGLVYELALVALGSYLIGDTVGQASIVLSVMVFAMGIGALLAKPLQRRAEAAFAGIEIALALLGGLSVLLLYAAFAWLSLYIPVLVVIALTLGLLIGAEIPLLMVLLQRIRRQDAGSAVADLFAADYVGALLGGLAFPFILLPVFGQIRGALLVGALNAVVGLGLVLTVFGKKLARHTRTILSVGAIAVTVVLVTTFALAGRFELSARQALYADPVVHAERTPYQEIVITESFDSDVRFYLNGDLQFSSVDEYRYHEALVHPVLAGPHDRVLILGGGDGLGLREVLSYQDVHAVTLVELDPRVIDLARTEPSLVELNGNAFADPRVEVVNADAFTWLRHNASRYDAVIVDMPDPDSTATAKLYSVEFYALVKRVLTDDGRMVVQSGSPYFAPKTYWCVERSIQEAGLVSVPYSTSVPSFGDWGFHLASAKLPQLRLPDNAPALRSLDADSLRAAAVFPVDRRRLPGIEASTLMRPLVLEYAKQEWQNY